jgi:hypothetical protein
MMNFCSFSASERTKPVGIKTDSGLLAYVGQCRFLPCSSALFSFFIIYRFFFSALKESLIYLYTQLGIIASYFVALIAKYSLLSLLVSAASSSHQALILSDTEKISAFSFLKK